MGKKVLWGSVNYRTEHYFPWKLKMAYENENKDLFDYMIVDNSPVHDVAFFDSLKQQYPGIIVTPHIPVDVNRTSGEHGSGLDIILDYARKNEYDYLFINDPDFFWVQKNLLPFFIKEVEENKYTCIGAPYTIPLKHWDFNTPCAFGAFYDMKFLDGLSFACDKDQHQVVIGGKDVGWEIRQKIATTQAKYLVFTQSDVPPSEFIGGSHAAGMHYSFQALLRQYHLRRKRISYHLHRGSFASHLDSYSKDNWRSDRNTDTAPLPDLWIKTREAYCDRYNEELKNSVGF